MTAFDISRFRDLAFGRASEPGHPLQDEKSVQKMIADLPLDPLAGLAELTHWVVSINTDDTFSAGQRARVLSVLHDASQPIWSALAELYLAPDATPAEDRDGDSALLRAMLESASEFSTGFALSLQASEQKSRWVETNFARLALYRIRWLARRLMLCHMMHLPTIDDIWEDLHLLYALTEAKQVFRKVMPVRQDGTRTSSVRQEYVRLLLMELADHETLRGREVELAYRISGRVAASARLEPQPIPGAVCVFVPEGPSRPGSSQRFDKSAGGALYLDTVNCLPRLKAMIETDVTAEPDDPDTLFGPGYTLGERNAMVKRLIEHWGPTPPQRRSKRVALKAQALVQGGYENAARVIRSLDQGKWKEAGSAVPQMRILLNTTANLAKPAAWRKSLADTSVELLDASVAGVGLLVPRKEAPWAALGALIAVYVDPGPDWVVGVIRRIGAERGLLRLGISILSRHPRLVWFHLESTGYASVWEDEKRYERNFLEHFQRGILLNADRVPLAPGDILLAHGVANRGSRLDVPYQQGVQRIRVTDVREATGDFHRVAFESIGVAAYGEEVRT